MIRGLPGGPKHGNFQVVPGSQGAPSSMCHVIPSVLPLCSDQKPPGASQKAKLGHQHASLTPGDHNLELHGQPRGQKRSRGLTLMVVPVPQTGPSSDRRSLRIGPHRSAPQSRRLWKQVFITKVIRKRNPQVQSVRESMTDPTLEPRFSDLKSLSSRFS